MKKLTRVAIIVLVALFSVSCYGEGIDSSSKNNKEEKKSLTFDPNSNLTSRYARGKILSGKSKKSKKKKNVIELSYQGERDPFMSFSTFVLGGPTNEYSGFIETIYYREGIRIKDIYCDSDAVKTDKVGIFFTNLTFMSTDGDQYLYKHVPYMVLNDRPSLFFSDIVFNEEAKMITGSINIPEKNKTYYIELFYLDEEEEYYYQEVKVKNKGNFEIKMSREGNEENMYLRVSDGYGNYGDACSVAQKESFKYESLETIDKSVAETESVKEVISKNFLFLFGLLFVAGSFILAILTKIMMKKPKTDERKK